MGEKHRNHSMNKYKAKVRIATKEYEFVELEIEGSPDDIAEAYNEMEGRLKGREGLETARFNVFLDRYIMNEPVSSEDYACMSKYQTAVVQEIKKSIKRIKAKQV